MLCPITQVRTEHLLLVVWIDIERTAEAEDRPELTAIGGIPFSEPTTATGSFRLLTADTLLVRHAPLEHPESEQEQRECHPREREHGEQVHPLHRDVLAGSRNLCRRSNQPLGLSPTRLEANLVVWRTTPHRVG